MCLSVCLCLSVRVCLSVCVFVSVFRDEGRIEKYRPRLLDDIVGNEEAVERLKVIAEDGNMPNLLLVVRACVCGCMCGCTYSCILVMGNVFVNVHVYVYVFMYVYIYVYDFVNDHVCMMMSKTMSMSVCMCIFVNVYVRVCKTVSSLPFLIPTGMHFSADPGTSWRRQDNQYRVLGKRDFPASLDPGRAARG